MSLTKASYSMITGAPINVLDYGADPTGTNDSSAAFTSALAAVTSASSTVVANGTFKFSTGITIPTGATLEFVSNSKINFTPDSGNLFSLNRGSNLIGNGSYINFTNASNLGAAIYLNGQQWFLDEQYGTTVSGFTISSTATTGGIGIILDATLTPILFNCAISFVRMYDMSFSTIKFGILFSAGNLITQYITGNIFQNFIFNNCPNPVSGAATSPAVIQANVFENFQIETIASVATPAIGLQGAFYNYFTNLQVWDWTGGGNPIILNSSGNNLLQTNVLYPQITNASAQIIQDTTGNTVIPSGSIGFNYGQQRFGQTAVAYNTNERVTIASTVVGAGFNIQGGGSSLGIGMYGGQATGSTNANALEFQNNSSAVVGSIKFNGTTTTYATTSDKDMKTDLGVCTDTSVIDNTVIHDYVWTKENITDRGVFAQDAFLVKPSAIHKGTDVIDSKGNKVDPWCVDYSKYVPDLIVYVKKLKADFEAYKASHP